MADNVTITPGSGVTVATDEVVDATLGTVEVQFIKIMDGTLDSTNKAEVSASGALSIESNDLRRQMELQYLQSEVAFLNSIDPRGYDFKGLK